MALVALVTVAIAAVVVVVLFLGYRMIKGRDTIESQSKHTKQSLDDETTVFREAETSAFCSGCDGSSQLSICCGPGPAQAARGN